jgi:hypothetical protein
MAQAQPNVQLSIVAQRVARFLPQLHWGLNFYGVSWCGVQLGYFTDWREVSDPDCDARQVL